MPVTSQGDVTGMTQTGVGGKFCRFRHVDVPSVSMNWEPILVERACRRHHLLHRSDVADLGVPPATWHRIEQSGLWVELVPGIFRHAATPLTFDMQVLAGAEWLGAKGALFGTSALHWWGVDVEEPAHAEFLVPRSTRWVPHWIDLHTTTRWNPDDVVRHRGVRVTLAARAILDMAYTERRAHVLERAIDSAIRLRRASLSQLHQQLEALRGKGRHGCRLMQELLLDSGGESYLERRFLRLVRLAGLPRPECQVIIRSDGARIARVDFLFGRQLVVEVSGRLGHTSDSDRRRDARRRNELQREGLTVIEFTTADVIDESPHVLRTLHHWSSVMSLTTKS